ncbi:SRPBCC family protein [Streptomyces sp. LP05-1]|uniref:SRPBCC family protein n=1 Tax=Streptomyces pyxinae TaxID=2970734 RepID=A0ABT2CHY2_9ACTN|nr:SRPBCC family protein [Streptomyces sp. LP05-1]MCS0637011.1 SRPBCC family protein [Streptomyces sp. LP05-1]
MSLFRVDRRTELPVAEAWRRLTDWSAHGALMPLTRVRVVTPGPSRAGTLFTARTGAGPLGFDDPMEVVRWESPADGRPGGRCRLEKRGRRITGWAEIEVRAEHGATRVSWTEEARVRGLPRFCDPLLAWGARLAFGRVVDGLLAGAGRR